MHTKKSIFFNSKWLRKGALVYTVEIHYYCPVWCKYECFIWKNLKLENLYVYAFLAILSKCTVFINLFSSFTLSH